MLIMLQEIKIISLTTTIIGPAWGYEKFKIRRGTSYWAGFYNTYFTIDYQNEFALFHFTQILPFNDKESYNLFTDFERLVYKNK